jgi:hypothetical protein
MCFAAIAQPVAVALSAGGFFAVLFRKKLRLGEKIKITR